jgi:Cof subfamily protein (haloacid dehalogenase superfamily)
MTQVVASDLDGTLLRPDFTISERTRKAIDRVRQAGVTFVAVTGRPPRSVRQLSEQLGLEGTAICANGALVYDIDSDSVLDQTLMARDVALRIVHGLRNAAPGVVFAWEDEESFGRESGWGRPPLAPGGSITLGDPLELLTAPVAKVLALHPEMGSDELAARARAVAGNEAVITWSTRELVEVSAAGVTKASALERFCERLGVGREQVLAIGDNENDLPMLQWAGRSAAVANASESVLAMVDEVTASNLDDGVALLLERVLEETERTRPDDSEYGGGGSSSSPGADR